MATSDLEDSHELNNKSALEQSYIKALYLLVVRNLMLFVIFAIFLLMIADVFGQSFGLADLFRTDSALLAASNWDYLLLPLESGKGLLSPGFWGHVATTLLMVTILTGAVVKEILHNDVAENRSIIIKSVIKYGLFFAFCQILAVIWRDFWEGWHHSWQSIWLWKDEVNLDARLTAVWPDFLPWPEEDTEIVRLAVAWLDIWKSDQLKVMILDVWEALVGAAIGFFIALICIAVASVIYGFADKKWADEKLGEWLTYILKKVTVQSLWHNSSRHAGWILLYFVLSVLIVVGTFFFSEYSEIVVPGVALCVLVILIVAIYLALSSIRPAFRVPIILIALAAYSPWSIEYFKNKFPNFTVAGIHREEVNFYDCRLRMDLWNNKTKRREFDCDHEKDRPRLDKDLQSRLHEDNQSNLTAGRTRSLSEPRYEGKDPTAASKVVEGNGTLDQDTCVMMESWRARTAGGIPNPDQLQERCAPASSWQTRNVLPKDQLRESKRPKLVVVAASGGAYRAGFWTALVLDELIARSNSHPPLKNLTKHINLLTGASGGMVAAAYFAAMSSKHDWSPEDSPSIKGRLQMDIKNSRKKEKFKKDDPIDRDSLGPIAQQTLQLDVLRSMLPTFTLEHLPERWHAWIHWGDRGLVLERQWMTLDKTFADLETKTGENQVPGLILSPMIVDTGQPLLISNLSMADVVDNSEDAALDFFQLFPEMRDKLNLQTAVRMNASFPYISPAVSLPTKPIMRVVDAGYYDNYGINTAVAWLSKPGMVDYLRDETSGVVIIQIRAYSATRTSAPEQKPEASSDDESGWGFLPDWLTAPITGISQARSSSMLFRNNKEIRLLSGLFCKGFVQTVVFENTLEDKDISMSWYLREEELSRMELGLKQHAPEYCAAPKTKFEKANCKLQDDNAKNFEELETIWRGNETDENGCKKEQVDQIAEDRLPLIWR